jgi:hypothetical protein
MENWKGTSAFSWSELLASDAIFLKLAPGNQAGTCFTVYGRQNDFGSREQESSSTERNKIDHIRSGVPQSLKVTHSGICKGNDRVILFSCFIPVCNANDD